MAGSFRRLAVYRLAVALADDLHREVQTWRPLDLWSVGIQVVRAADSVGANIAEATGRWSSADKRRLLLIARGSLNELEHWLMRAEERRLVDAGFASRVDEVARALNGMIKRPN